MEVKFVIFLKFDLQFFNTYIFCAAGDSWTEWFSLWQNIDSTLLLWVPACE